MYIVYSMNDQSQDIVKQPLPEVSRNGVRIGPKYEAFQILRDNGLNPGRAAQALGMAKQSGYEINKQLDKRYDLTSKKYIKLASKVIKNVLAGEAREDQKVSVTKDGQIVDYIDKSYPSHTNQIAVAQMIYDRVQPLIQRSININASLDIHPVDLSDYLDVGPARAGG